MKAALVFGGQGAQFTGMGQKVYDHSQKARDVFEFATSIVGYDVATMCFEAPQEELNKTVYCQICTLTVELALYEVFKEHGIRPDAVAGFSLGEYAALVASNVISMDDAFRLVSVRAQAMEDSVKDGIGKMAAVIKLNIEQVETICNDIGNNNAMIANYNSYKQLVVSMTADIYDEFVGKIKSLGGQIIPLKVNRPFHHSLMRPAAEKYHAELQKYKFAAPDCSIYINVTGEKFDEYDSFSMRLYEQVFTPIQWIKTIKNMMSDGIDTFYEISPKSTIASFINSIFDGCAKVIDVQNEMVAQFNGGK
jgi:[acyl-carrier-protein] S-malonyltransferase